MKFALMPKVALIYRKPRATGNFSIETSFDQLMQAWPADSKWKLEKFVSSFLSNGLLGRWRATREVADLSAELYHVTGDVHFLALGLPGKRTILTIHDCGFIEDHSGWRQWLLKKLWLDWPVRHCSRITAVSQATKDDIIRYTGCPQEKIEVVPTIVSPDFQPASHQPLNEKPVVLHIGLAPNKNFRRHVEALAGLDCRMHIIGKLKEEHKQLLSVHGIDYFAEHNISNADLQKAYEYCDLLLFASTLEGFGMPIIEAQAVGRPVITSNCSSMPEVAGEGACLVDPLQVESIRDGLLRIIENPAYRAELVTKGTDNVKRFRVEEIARQYEEVYYSLMK